MNTDKAKSLVGKEVLFSLADNDAIRKSAISAVSPNGLYVRLMSDRWDGECVGWVRVEDVKILDVF